MIEWKCVWICGCDRNLISFQDVFFCCDLWKIIRLVLLVMFVFGLFGFGSVVVFYCFFSFFGCSFLNLWMFQGLEMQNMLKSWKNLFQMLEICVLDIFGVQFCLNMLVQKVSVWWNFGLVKLSWVLLLCSSGLGCCRVSDSCCLNLLIGISIVQWFGFCMCLIVVICFFYFGYVCGGWLQLVLVSRFLWQQIRWVLIYYGMLISLLWIMLVFQMFWK